MFSQVNKCGRVICLLSLHLSFLVLFQNSTAQRLFPVFTDEFEDNRNGWLVGDRPKTKAFIANGYFELSGKRPKYSYSRRTERGFIRANQNFEIEIKLRQTSGTIEKGFALEWGGNSIDNSFYRFWIRGDGKYSVDFFNGATRVFTDFQPWTYSSAIDSKGFNILKVRKVQDSVKFIVNEREVFQQSFNGLLGSEIGFITPPLSTVQVDHLRVSLIDELPKSVLVKAGTPNIHVVIVAISDYVHPSISDLSFTTNDGEAMKHFYTSPNGGAVPEENLSFLQGELATKENIMKTLKEKLLGAKENDMVIFYYAGHGDALGATAPKPLYLIPYDFVPTQLQTGIAYTEIEKLFELSAANKKLWVMDACHSGGSLPQLKGHFYDHLEGLRDQDIAILTSSELGETSLEIATLGQGRGLFSYFLTEALVSQSQKCDSDQNGIISILELYNYVREEVSQLAKEQYYHSQNPQLGGKFNALLPIGEIGYR